VAAGRDTLVAVTVAVLAGAAILFPSLALLFRLVLGGDIGRGESASGQPTQARSLLAALAPGLLPGLAIAWIGFTKSPTQPGRTRSACSLSSPSSSPRFPRLSHPTYCQSHSRTRMQRKRTPGERPRYSGSEDAQRKKTFADSLASPSQPAGAGTDALAADPIEPVIAAVRSLAKETTNENTGESTGESTGLPPSGAVRCSLLQ
jgi:hypothetical protein